MASDSAATLSTGAAATIGQQRVKKIINLSSSILYAATGSVGMSQLVSHAVSTVWKGQGTQFQQAGFMDGEVMRVLGAEIAKTVHTYLQTGALTRQLGAMVLARSANRWWRCQYKKFRNCFASTSVANLRWRPLTFRLWPWAQVNQSPIPFLLS